MTAPITVKILSRLPAAEWLRYFPGGEPVWGRCRFSFERSDRRYDWLVVYDDLPPGADGRRDDSCETLACPRAQTVLVTTEPSTIKAYGGTYTAQFGYVLTSQEAWALPHPGRIYSQAGLCWYYGIGRNHIRSLDEMRARPPADKTRLLSAASSAKRQRHTLHHLRYRLVHYLGERLPEMDVFGHGIRPMDDKAEAVDPYRYHLAIENHIAPHHWTEKLSDAFLGMTLPFYCGAPNAADYFPAESFIALDIHRPEECYRTIRETLTSDAYQRRLPSIREARQLVLDRYHLIAMLSRIIGETGIGDGAVGFELCSRHTLRRRHPRVALQGLAEKFRQRLHGALGR